MASGMLAHRIREQRGFTLIEMMVVMAIIALIAVFAVPNITNALQNSRIKSVESQARQIQNAFDQYYNGNNSYPAGSYLADTDSGTVGNQAATTTQAYAHFFGLDSVSNNGILYQYISLPTSIGDALYIPRAYSVTTGTSQTAPVYELVIEVKNVNSVNKYIHMTKDSVTRSSDTATTQGSSVWTGS